MLRFLRSHGILGINARNLLYVRPYNKREAIAFADDKLKTKAFLSARGIPTAKIYQTITSRADLRTFDAHALPHTCVLKPNFGFGGEGILILRGRNKKGEFLVQGKAAISDKQLKEHIEDILDGSFSVNGRADTAFFEEILTVDERLALLRPAGLPDIRIIVFNLVPVMAMLRIPTIMSGGKANMHLGGIGIGIDIARGETTYAAQYHGCIQRLPHGLPVKGIQIPHWEDMLLIASRIQSMTNIGYLAVDLTLDEHHGPMLLEVNARAGLSVQLANRAPLRARLDRVSGLSVSTPEKGVRLAQELFGERRDEDRDVKVDRPVIGLHETIIIRGDGIAVEEPCMIQSDQEETMFDPTFIAELEKRNLFERRPGEGKMLRVRFTLGGKKIQTVVRERALDGTRVSIGKRDLQGLLIDTGKTSHGRSLCHRVRQDLRAIDHQLGEYAERIHVLPHLRPTNLDEELQMLRANEEYNPTFRYSPIPQDLLSIRQGLQRLHPDDSGFGKLCQAKCGELISIINVLEARGDDDRFLEHIQKLYGVPTDDDVIEEEFQIQTPAETEEPELNTMAAKKIFEECLGSYGLHDWHVTIKSSMIADCAVGGTSIFLREGATFSRVRLDALIAHEIETHVLTSVNGSAQPFELLRAGCAGYLVTQEGLALVNQERVLPAGHIKRYLHRITAAGLSFAMHHTFAETRAFYRSKGLTEEKAIMKAIDSKRGMIHTVRPGASTRGLVYSRGYDLVTMYLEAGGDERALYVGKVNLNDLPILQALEWLESALILPHRLRG